MHNHNRVVAFINGKRLRADPPRHPRRERGGPRTTFVSDLRGGRLLLRLPYRDNLIRSAHGFPLINSFWGTMHVAIVTFDGFNELDSLIALSLLGRVKRPGWRVSIASNTPRIKSMNGVVLEAQSKI